MNQGKRRLNQSLRFVRAAPLNLRDCATSDASLSSSHRGCVAAPVHSGVGRYLRRVYDDVAHQRAIEKCLMARKRLNFAENGMARTE